MFKIPLQNCKAQTCAEDTVTPATFEVSVLSLMLFSFLVLAHFVFTLTSNVTMYYQLIN